MSVIDYFIWSNGESEENKKSIFRNQTFELVKELEGKPIIQNIYIQDNCALFIADGRLYKRGNFKWEKNFDSDSIRPVEGAEKESIFNCVLGESHVIFQCESGKIFSWGDNYYGQLGLNNFMVPVIFKPQQITHFEKNKIKIVKILAHKNSCFAVDKNKKLWVWGKSDMLGGKFLGNRFKPEMIMSNYKIENLKIQDNRIIISVLKEKEDDKVNDIEIIKEKIVTKTEKTNQEITKANDVIKNKAETFEDHLIEKLKKISEKVNNFSTSMVERYNNTFISIDKIISKPANEVKNSENNYWDKLEILLKTNNQIIKNKDDNEEKKQIFQLIIDSFCELISFNIDSKNEQKEYTESTRYKKAKERIDKCTNELIEIFKIENTENTSFKNFVSFIKTLMKFYLRYKKICIMTYKMSSHQYMMQSFKFKDILEGIQTLKREKNYEKKLHLIDKTLEEYSKPYIKRITDTLKNIDITYDCFSNLNLIIDEDKNDEDEIGEKMIYKTLIESTFILRDLWVLIKSTINLEKKLNENINSYIYVTDRIFELYAIHRQLYSMNIKKIYKNSEGKDESEIKEEIILLIREIDGITYRLETFFAEKIQTIREKRSGLELLYMYCSALTENAYLRKQIFELIKNTSLI